jgi:lysophospholipase L1-like esterase
VIRYFPYTGWVMREYVSSTMNVGEDGVRHTAATTATTDVFRVYMFGGSTTLCADVPDELTLPSQLATALGSLRPSGAKPVEVVNYGTSAYSSTQELLRLLHEMQRRFARRGKPDLVVFYDGVNDVWAGVHLGHPGYPDAHERMQQRFDDLAGFLRLKLREMLEARSALARRWLSPGTSRTKEKSHHGHAALAREQAAIYAENRKVAAGWGREAGFDVLHVLQPVLFVQESGHEADADLKKSLAEIDPELASANVEGYRELRALFAGASGAVDLSAALDGVPQPLYIDYCHLGPEGNRLVAQRLAAAIQARLQ